MLRELIQRFATIFRKQYGVLFLRERLLYQFAVNGRIINS